MNVDKIRVDWLNEFETWQQVADAIGCIEHEYDMSDDSHRLDLAQIVCSAIAKLAKS